MLDWNLWKAVRKSINDNHELVREEKENLEKFCIREWYYEIELAIVMVLYKNILVVEI